MIRQKLTQRQLELELAGLKEKLRKLNRLSDKERPERTRRAKADFGFFCDTYFPHLGNDKTNQFHAWLHYEAPKWGPGDRVEIAAPRGNAKTTKISRQYVLWKIARGEVWNVIIISDTLDQSKLTLESLKLELEENARLADDFPDICGTGRVWQAEACITASGCRIMAAGAGKRIRGINYRGKRPDLIILDDLENDENIRTKEQRDKLEHWFKHTVLFLGPPDRTELILYVGTYLHYDGLMARIKRRGDFKHHKFRALIRQPDRMDLWDMWERIWHDSKDEARAFHEARRHDMEQGAEVLWPGVQPLYSLMEMRAADRKAFSAEMQNEPLDEDSRVFDPEKFHFWVQKPVRMVTVGACDPSMGKQRGDPSALQILGRCLQTNKIYDLYSQIKRLSPQRIIADIIALQKEYRCARWGIEEVQFQEFFKQQLLVEGLKKGVPIPAVGLKTGGVAKEIRIEGLAPHIHSGTILLNRKHKTLLEQLEFYPMADHDDGPDALEMAFRLIFSMGKFDFKSAAPGGLRGRLRGRGF